MTLIIRFSVFCALVLATFSPARALMHFDNDEKSDFSVYRASDRTWYTQSSESGASNSIQFGLPTDVLTPGDYDGDGITDIAVWRPENGYWYAMMSKTGKFFAVQWGMTTKNPFGSVADVPVPADYDGDGTWDFAVWRPDTGYWYALLSTEGFNPKHFDSFAFGKLGDVPVPGDYDGDRVTDYAVFRTGENRWYFWMSETGSLRSTRLGQSGADLLVPADYTGDGKVDPAVYHDGVWLYERSEDRQIATFFFGTATDAPVPADYDGDKKADFAVYRDGVWLVNQSQTNGFLAVPFGTADDDTVNSAYVRCGLVGVS